jgi:4-hydroxy-3-methylbut-2-enyl diphosphate reductase
MNRSLLSQRFRAALELGSGELAVAAGFEHPDRGPVRCPAAGLVAAGLAGEGRRVRLERVRVETADAALGEGDVALFAACYLDPRGGGAVGFAVAARRDDRESLEAARRTVADWASVLRTRQVLVAGTDAVEADAGVQASCPHVQQAQTAARMYAERGDSVILIGGGGDLAAASILEHARGRGILVRDASDVDSLLVPDPQRVTFVLQPGLPVEDAAPVIEALRARFGRLPGQHPEQFCYAASDRRAALASVARCSDLLLVLGARDDPQAARLLDWSGAHPVERHLLDDARRIPRHPLRCAATVGIAPAPSARPGLLDEVLEALSGLGPTAVSRRTVTTRRFGPAPAGDRPNQPSQTTYADV